MSVSSSLLTAIDRAVVVIGTNAHRLRFVSADTDERSPLSARRVVITVETIYGGELVRASSWFTMTDLGDTPFVVRCLVNRIRAALANARNAS
jgi:hypothetical protein